MDAARNRATGKPLRLALEEVGLAGRERLVIDPGRYKGALEMHIEQGTQLENAGLRIGVVTGIVAIRQFRIMITGQQDHTGGTTMRERRDAGLTAMRLLGMIDREFPRICADRSVWTTGRIALEPNAPMIIPGQAELVFSFRDLSLELNIASHAASCARRVARSRDRPRRSCRSRHCLTIANPTSASPGLPAFPTRRPGGCPIRGPNRRSVDHR